MEGLLGDGENPPLSMQTPNLGEAHFASKTCEHTISDDIRIPERIEVGSQPGVQFEAAGPRARRRMKP